MVEITSWSSIPCLRISETKASEFPELPGHTVLHARASHCYQTFHIFLASLIGVLSWTNLCVCISILYAKLNQMVWCFFWSPCRHKVSIYSDIRPGDRLTTPNHACDTSSYLHSVSWLTASPYQSARYSCHQVVLFGGFKHSMHGPSSYGPSIILCGRATFLIFH